MFHNGSNYSHLTFKMLLLFSINLVKFETVWLRINQNVLNFRIEGVAFNLLGQSTKLAKAHLFYPDLIIVHAGHFIACLNPPTPKQKNYINESGVVHSSEDNSILFFLQRRTCSKLLVVWIFLFYYIFYN